jgi:uracil-DNA glycosylase family 4
MAAKKTRTGFFSESSFRSIKTASTTPQCGICGLHKNSSNPRLPVLGKGKAKILIVSGCVGEYEDRYKKHLAGNARTLIKNALRKQGISLTEDCWTTSAVICRRNDDETEYKKSKKSIDKKVEACRPNLLKTIEKLKPRAIILLGSTAAKSLIPVIFKNPLDIPHRWNDFYIPCRDYNAWVTFTFYPSNILTEKGNAHKLIFNNVIKKIVQKAKKRPWRNIPDYESQVEVIMNPAQAAKELKRMRKDGGDFSFDYEANCLKSKLEGAKIYSCAVSLRGKQTISFPWQREAIEAMDRLLKSPAGKIAANMKFENRWTKTHLGHFVNNWIHDTMLAAHILNNSPKVSNLTFQAFVRLGMPCYDQNIKPYLKSDNASTLNRIHKVDLKDLLMYGGLDALLEYKLAVKQIKEFKRRGILE